MPGIGQFTIVDNSVVNEADLGVNFFLDDSCLGKSRAQCCAELLLELNPEVQGDWFPKKEVRVIQLRVQVPAPRGDNLSDVTDIGRCGA